MPRLVHGTCWIPKHTLWCTTVDGVLTHPAKAKLRPGHMHTAAGGAHCLLPPAHFFNILQAAGTDQAALYCSQQTLLKSNGPTYFAALPNQLRGDRHKHPLQSSGGRCCTQKPPQAFAARATPHVALCVGLTQCPLLGQWKLHYEAYIITVVKHAACSPVTQQTQVCLSGKAHTTSNTPST
jgi:hypothetical protein